MRGVDELDRFVSHVATKHALAGDNDSFPPFLWGTCQVAVAFMIGGALVAAMYDLEFEFRGYLLILASDVFTAAYGVSIKHALNLDIPQMR